MARLAVAGVLALLALPALAAAAVQQPRTHYATALGGTDAFRDGRELPFSARAGDGGGVVGRRFMHRGRRYRSGFVVLRGNAVRWAITPVGRGLYGDAPPTAWNDCGNVAAERELLRAQRSPLLTQPGVWELRSNANRGPTSADYNRLNQAIGALDEAIFAFDQRTYECPS